MVSTIQVIVCVCLALGAEVQAIHHLAHESEVAAPSSRQSPFGSSGGASASTVAYASAAAYYIADACSEPAQCVVDSAECGAAATFLGLSAGANPSVAYGGSCAEVNGEFYYYANNQPGAQSVCKLPVYSVATTSSCDPGYSAITDTTDCDAAAGVLGFTQGYWAAWNYGGSCAQWGAGWGSSTWYYHYASTEVGAKPICRLTEYVAATTSCPNGFVEITSTSECDAAGSALGYTPGAFVSQSYGGSCAHWDGGWGAMGANWYWHSASSQPGASLICAAAMAPPTPSPTPVPPTPSATPSPTAPPAPMNSAFGGGFGTPSPTGTVAAVGDPHLQNIRGERFDVMKQGRHVLINIPLGISAENALLRVEAEARRLGGSCSDMYFQALNVTGAWAEVKLAGGYHFKANDVETAAQKWIAFEKVELKVVHGRTQQGTLYLNFYVKHLGRVGLAVGGLLGEDDHSDAASAPEICVQRMSLISGAVNHGSTLSNAVALLE